MEWRPLIQGASVNQTVPGTDTYGGNFSSLLALTDAEPHLRSNVCGPNQQVAPERSLRQLSRRRGSCGNRVRAQFPGNIIPSCMINPNAAALVQAGIFPANNAWTAVEMPSSRAAQTPARPCGKKSSASIITSPASSPCSDTTSPSKSHRVMRSASGAETTFLRSATTSAIRRIAPWCTRPTRSAQRSSMKSPSTTTGTASTSSRMRPPAWPA